MKTYNTLVKYWLVFILVGVSTMPIFKQSFGIYLLVGSVILTLRGLRINREAFGFLLLALVLEIYHNFTFENYEFATTRQILLVFAAALFIVYYLKLEFLDIYIRILYYFSLISFVFFIFYYANMTAVTGFAHAIPGVFTKTNLIYGEESKQIDPIFYNFDANFLDLGRNNGPFWEPTVFATMLIIAQIFNLLLNKVLFNRKGIVFTLAILTTLSTTGFLAYFLLIVCYFLLSSRIRFFTKLVVTLGFVGIAAGLYTSLPFLSDKISNEIEMTDHEIDKYGGDSRLASAILDMRDLTEKNTYLFFGRGLSGDQRSIDNDKESLRNCGDTTLMVQWGVPFTVIYLSLLYFSFFQLTRVFEIHWAFSIVFTILILILGFSEVYFNLPFFYALLFFGFVVKRFYHKPAAGEDASEEDYPGGRHYDLAMT